MRFSNCTAFSSVLTTSSFLIEMRLMPEIIGFSVGVGAVAIAVPVVVTGFFALFSAVELFIAGEVAATIPGLFPNLLALNFFFLDLRFAARLILPTIVYCSMCDILHHYHW